MPKSIALALPLVPGKLEDWQAFIAELNGPRAAEFSAHQARGGVTRQSAFHQPTPQGDIAIFVFEVADAQHMMSVLLASTDPFDLWFIEQLAENHGLSREILAQLRPGALVYEWRAETPVA